MECGVSSHCHVGDREYINQFKQRLEYANQAMQRVHQMESRAGECSSKISNLAHSANQSHSLQTIHSMQPIKGEPHQSPNTPIHTNVCTKRLTDQLQQYRFKVEELKGEVATLRAENAAKDEEFEQIQWCNDALERKLHFLQDEACLQAKDKIECRRASSEVVELETEVAQLTCDLDEATRIARTAKKFQCENERLKMEIALKEKEFMARRYELETKLSDLEAKTQDFIGKRARQSEVEKELERERDLPGVTNSTHEIYFHE